MRQLNDVKLTLDGQETTLAEVIRLHRLWLDGDGAGKRADLRGADLRGADLSETDLSEADLSVTDLRGADLRGAGLYGADLRWADLSEANLCGTNLSWANLSWANLRGARFLITKQELTVSKDMSNFTRVVGSRHDGFRVGNYLKIGCEEHTVAYWLENVRALAEKADYTAVQVAEYERLVAYAALCAEEAP